MSLKIIVWDVQHGSATYMQTPNGTHIVKDLGTGSFGENDRKFSPLIHLKNKYDVSRLDYIIISHPHKDHIDDILNFDSLRPRVLTRPSHLSREDIMKDVKEEDKPLFEKYLEINERYNQTVPRENDPSLAQNNGGVEISHFHPKKSSTSNINNHSIVTVVQHAGTKIIIPGDNEPPSWKELLESDDFKDAIRDADIFVAPHHGRESGYCPEIFEYFKPRLTVISDDVESGTSATDKYSKLSTGWTVHHRSGRDSEKRYCVTTRSDGYILIELGYNDDHTRYIYVRIA
jgi:competence protein ComEC